MSITRVSENFECGMKNFQWRCSRLSSAWIWFYLWAISLVESFLSSEDGRGVVVKTAGPSLKRNILVAEIIWGMGRCDPYF